ncbi:methylmalonyl Co-A mutase-associated GTPase MeaB [Flagellimonas sp. S174]|uniref:methylmalonyl Co-A mutase-associated GTPase MeaB n=1 Tax=Flagellimonas sp. S174 TaxID=3410790 RepID=UPI003BF5CCFF
MDHKQNIPVNTALKIKALRKEAIDPQNLVNGILKMDKASLGKAITLLESSKTEHLSMADEIIEKCLPHAAKSVRIGITGVPGVGKSTFIEVFGKTLTNLGKKVAVLAVDPSSSLSKGSILGDKTRMEELSKDPNAFIRPSPSGESLGGVAQKTRETIVLCEAAGYDVILIETVGVGQSETVVHSMVDFFLLLKLSGAGDELQGIKRGIMEMADAIAINKADGKNKEGAKLAQTEFSRALHLYPPKENDWIPKVLACSATENSGIVEIWHIINEFLDKTKQNGHFQRKRNLQNKNWFLQSLNQQLTQILQQNEAFEKAKKNMLVAVEKNTISPFKAAREVLKAIHDQLK